MMSAADSLSTGSGSDNEESEVRRPKQPADHPFESSPPARVAVYLLLPRRMRGPAFQASSDEEQERLDEEQVVEEPAAPAEATEGEGGGEGGGEGQGEDAKPAPNEVTEGAGAATVAAEEQGQTRPEGFAEPGCPVLKVPVLWPLKELKAMVCSELEHGFPQFVEHLKGAQVTSGRRSWPDDAPITAVFATTAGNVPLMYGPLEIYLDCGPLLSGDRLAEMLEVRPLNPEVRRTKPRRHVRKDTLAVRRTLEGNFGPQPFEGPRPEERRRLFERLQVRVGLPEDSSSDSGSSSDSDSTGESTVAS